MIFTKSTLHWGHVTHKYNNSSYIYCYKVRSILTYVFQIGYKASLLYKNIVLANICIYCNILAFYVNKSENVFWPFWEWYKVSVFLWWLNHANVYSHGVVFRSGFILHRVSVAILQLTRHILMILHVEVIYNFIHNQQNIFQVIWQWQWHM